MKKLKHILLLAGIISLASCSFLDMEPQDFLAPSQYYQTEADLETALTGIYSTLHDGALYKNYMLGRLGLDADLGYDNRDGDVGTSSQYLTAAVPGRSIRFIRISRIFRIIGIPFIARFFGSGGLLRRRHRIIIGRTSGHSRQRKEQERDKK